ncbi:hypothetical protein FISHEDRAFT_16542, partial [Fistulina hepatica ATCC 64428]
PENELCDLKLTKEEWDVAAQLHDVLKILKDTTLHFSYANAPNLATVIPAIDKINNVFTDTIWNIKISTGIHSAICLSKCKLNNYYSATDASNMYHIAMILYPQHKLMYFQKAGWPVEWINTA